MIFIPGFGSQHFAEIPKGYLTHTWDVRYNRGMKYSLITHANYVGRRG